MHVIATGGEVTRGSNERLSIFTVKLLRTITRHALIASPPRDRHTRDARAQE